MMHRTRLSGVDVVDVGSGGTAVLLLHGIGGSADSFRPQLEELSRVRRVLAWDAPGYGDSPNLPDDATLDDYVAVVNDLINALGERPVHVLGVSWGGVIALRLAWRNPRALRSLVLASSSRGSGRTSTASTAMRQRAEDLVAAGPAEFARARGKKLVSPRSPPEVAEHVVDTMSRVRYAGYANAARSMADTDHSAVLGEVSTPTLVLVGTDDVVTGVEESQRLADGIPTARMEHIVGAGHAANQERPAEFNGAVAGFLAEVDGQEHP